MPARLPASSQSKQEINSCAEPEFLRAIIRLTKLAVHRSESAFGGRLGSWAAESLVTVSNQSLLWPPGSPRVEGWRSARGGPHRIPTSPPSAGDPHRIPTD